ncbi:hypothetical protein GOEFS_081_00350 [Gordonia effusa NBRC 100432]|uniref:N-acetyltransferase domain-containing protein n=1 Tax=Gordonia effusa NBRC 100432 TaxID=1077974 RepID=H0R2P4_9ACTN|nr:N-acetyltransferase [Gordonia effusa]GAB19345.1 hypothetical protein GOEFS_081_00350 [Gordonia effusa NBRC 100432]
MTVRVVRLTGHDAYLWLDPALNIYVTAMGYPRGTEAHRAPLWREHIARPGWRAFGAIAQVSDLPTESRGAFAGRLNRGSTSLSRRRLRAPLAITDDEVLVGIAYGYRGAPDQWWNQQLRAGLRRSGLSPVAVNDIANDYFELTELHVHPSVQGYGLGQWLLTRLVAECTESRVLLSTPEVTGEENRAWSLYRRLGFTDVLRHFTFAGDPRPFAFLGRPLPLPVAPPSIGPNHN